MTPSPFAPDAEVRATQEGPPTDTELLQPLRDCRDGPAVHTPEEEGTGMVQKSLISLVSWKWRTLEVLIFPGLLILRRPNPFRHKRLLFLLLRPGYTFPPVSIFPVSIFSCVPSPPTESNTWFVFVKNTTAALHKKIIKSLSHRSDTISL